jgi:hypothetical protein
LTPIRLAINLDFISAQFFARDAATGALVKDGDLVTLKQVHIIL